MEEDDSTRTLVEQPQPICNEHPATSPEGPTHPSSSQTPTALSPVMSATFLPQVPTDENSAVERARGEPAIHTSQSTQDSTLASCQHILGLLGQITEYQVGIMRELRAMHREMRLMKGEQRRTNARVVSLAHDIEELKEHVQQQ